MSGTRKTHPVRRSSETVPSSVPKHGQPRTRREMLAQGVIPYAAHLVMPGFLSMIASRAFGQGGSDVSCPAPGDDQGVKFIQIDCAGGISLASQVGPGGQGGLDDFLPEAGYATLGIGKAAIPQTGARTLTAGLPLMTQSAFLTGLTAAATPATLALMNGFITCVRSGDDQPELHGATQLIAKLTGPGSLVGLVGNEQGPSGMRARAITGSIDSTISPVQLERGTSVANIVNPGVLAMLAQRESTAQIASEIAVKVQQATRMMSQSAIDRFNLLSPSEQFKILVSCGYIKSSEMLLKYQATALNPANDADVTAVFPDYATNNFQQTVATISRTVLEGYSNVGGITLGGCDYHGNGRQAQDAKETELATIVGRISELARRKSKNVFIHITSDGSTSANVNGTPNANGYLPQSSDSGERGINISFIVRGAQPQGSAVRPEVSKHQIGWFNSAGADDTSSPVGGDTNRAAHIAALNFASVAGKMDLISKLNSPIAGEADKFIVCKKIV